jgi:conjugative transfer signal peptidase TraF
VLVVAVLGAFLGAAPPFHPPLLVWNASASVAIGLYAVEQPNDLHIADLVIVRPPEELESFLADRNYLPRGVPLVKHVLALAGQSVCRSDFVIMIDAVAVADARESDSRGRPLPSWQGCRIVRENEVFLLNPQSADSLDGRYFGVLPISSILGRALPLWTMKPLGES